MAQLPLTPTAALLQGAAASQQEQQGQHKLLHAVLQGRPAAIVQYAAVPRGGGQLTECTYTRRADSQLIRVTYFTFW